jgi:hypothetical protein
VAGDAVGIVSLPGSATAKRNSQPEQDSQSNPEINLKQSLFHSVAEGENI